MILQSAESTPGIRSGWSELCNLHSPMQKHVPLVDLHAQHAALKSKLLEAFERTLDRGDFILGGAVQEFETAFARLCGVSHGVGLGTGLDALRIALEALGIGPGDEVILPANTFIATALAVSAAGATPRLVDCNLDTFLIDVTQAANEVGPATRAILPVHLTGQCVDMDAILALAQRHHLPVVEDAAQAHGATYKGRSAGSMGVAGCFSFYPGKNLGACGDGGMLVSNDDGIAAYARYARNYGQRARYDHAVKGGNARLDTLQAAILGIKLPLLQEWNAARAKAAEQYRELLRGVGDLVLQEPAPGSTHVYHLFIIQTSRRDALQQFLKERGIDTGVHYPVPVHLQEAYRDLGYRPGDFPRAELLAGRMLSIPMHPHLTEETVEYVAGSIREFFGA